MKHLIYDSNQRYIKVLAKSIGQLRFDEFKLSDVNVLERLQTRLDKQANTEIHKITDGVFI